MTSLRVGRVEFGPAQLSVFDVPLPDPRRPIIGRKHAVATDTEAIAAARHLPRKGSQRARVLDELRRAGGAGLTDFDLWQLGIGARPHVPGTRREELIRDGWPIKDSGFRRPTDTGTPAIVWVYYPQLG